MAAPPPNIFPELALVSLLGGQGSTYLPSGAEYQYISCLSFNSLNYMIQRKSVIHSVCIQRNLLIMFRLAKFITFTTLFKGHFTLENSPFIDKAQLGLPFKLISNLFRYLIQVLLTPLKFQRLFTVTLIRKKLCSLQVYPWFAHWKEWTLQLSPTSQPS